MNRVIFLIDGFNLYHSIVEASKDLNGASTKWLNISSLCESYLHVIGGQAQTEIIYYFSALATHLIHRSPDKVERHKLFIRALKSTGIIEVLARFKPKEIFCNNCRNIIRRHEEKESDVAMASKMLEIFFKDDCDTVVLITGDTDIAPAVRTALRLFPQKNIYFGFPYKRKNKELASLTGKYFKITKEQIICHQFPELITSPSGEKLAKPMNW